MRPKRASSLRPASTLRLSKISRLRAAAVESVSTANARASPRNHSVKGTGKPILSLRAAITSGTNGLTACLKMCFIVPSLNLMSAGIVAASSTRR